jgi:hypothetical protein
MVLGTTGKTLEERFKSWIDTVGTITLPLLAGFNITFVIVVSDDAANFLLPGAAILVLAFAAVVLIIAVQCAYHARVYLFEQDPDYKRDCVGLTGVTGWRGPERRQHVVEERDRGARVDSGALPEGLLPPGLESRGQFLAHLLRGVGVQAAHARDLVSQSLLGQDLGDAVLGHPCLVAVSQAVRRQPVLDRQPAG